MPNASRRKFLVAAGTGAATAGVLSAVPGGASAAPPARAPRNARPLVVHVADPDGAELTIHSGDKTSVVRDRDLVLRLLHAAAKQG